MKKSFRTFFERATSHAPYDYQKRLAGDEPSECEGPNQGIPCVSKCINVPTGLGKTAAVVMAWLWNRVALNRPDWPRRLVYCLPMRTLVEQTRDNVRKYLLKLARARRSLGLSDETQENLLRLAFHSPIVLMGGEELRKRKRDWDTHPEKPAILIGTQDMLLSRALNRGYGMSRFRWPMHFALLNNDCLWILDETQLMGSGVETSAQFTAFRSRFSTVGSCATWWMSATLDFNRLKTVDYSFEAADGNRDVLSLAAEDRKQSSVDKRLSARKKIAEAPVKLNSDSKKDVDYYSKKLADWILKEHLKKHRPNTLTLVILNQVNRAQEVFHQIEIEKAKVNDSSAGSPALALIHSRFRFQERKQYERKLKESPNLICVATQAVEAGMDLDADLLITELAPWSSLVQRFGRCNRRGLWKDSRIFWINLRDDKAAAPYSLRELADSRRDLDELQDKDANPNTLGSVKISIESKERTLIRPVIRRKDVLDLFDTTPDLAGNDLDVSRYIRDGQDNDANVFWRELGENKNPTNQDQPQPSHKELCSVQISQLRKFLEDKKPKPKAFRWDVLEGKWELIDSNAVIPGGVYMLSADAGGYSTRLGWTGNPKESKVPPCRPPSGLLVDASESTGENSTSFLGVPVTLEQHTNNVARETSRLVQALPLAQWESVFSQVAQWHDVGKAHPEFQAMLRKGIDEATAPKELLAKSGTNKKGRCKPEYFRHELLSALAWLHNNSANPNGESVNLSAYLIASHHGKVRLSIRSLPKEKPPAEFKDKNKRIARGVVEGERMPAIQLGDIDLPEFTVDLSLMEMGAPQQSWLARMLALRDALGPFRLAFLEAVFRAADMIASQSEREEANQNDKS